TDGCETLARPTAAGDVVFDQATDGIFGGAVSGSGALIKGGEGRLTLTGDSTFGGGATIDEGELVIDGSVLCQILLDGASSLGGSGSIGGAILGAGMVGPGNSPGILTAAQVDPASGLDFSFEFTDLTPDYENPAASVNDILRLTDMTAPFLAALAGEHNSIDLYFDSALEDGDVYTGGFYTDKAEDFSSMISDASFNCYIRDTAGMFIYNGINYSLLVGPDVFVTTISQAAGFGTGITVNGFVSQFTVADRGIISQDGDVPEPSTLLLLLPLIGFGVWRMKRK
ncbi:MAG TPA: autotransporter-associated beta strand repeat-containing protein, partial [bacterium]|nr:autotransporter-associated beta strand repeat-containing protein [bacterium]